MIIGIDASRANIATRTGTEWYAFSLLRTWIQNNGFAGHSIRLYIREPLLNDFPPLPKNWEVRILSWKPGLLWTQIRLSIELLLHRIDILFVPAHTIPLIHPKKTFTTLHDVGFEKMHNVYNTAQVSKNTSSLLKKILTVLIRCITLGKYGANEYDYHRFSARFAITHAKTIFTVSQFSKNEIESIYKKHPPICVAYNGIDTSLSLQNFSHEKIHEIRKKYSLPNQYILSLGRVEKKKGSLELVQAYKKAVEQDAISQHLVFIGSFGFGSEEVRTFVTSHSLEEKVHFLGWLPQNDSMSLLAGAAVFAMLSSYEGFGVPVLQSILLGVPVLASDLEVFHEIAGDVPTYTDPKNIQATSEKIRRICLDVDFYRTKTIGAASAIKEKFTWEKSAKRIEDEIKKYLL